MKNQILVLALAGSFSVSAQAAITLFSENFDSYANGAAATTVPGITIGGFDAGDSATVSTAQALSGANSLKYTSDGVDAPDLNFNLLTSVNAAASVNGLNLSFSYQKAGDSYDPNIWVMFGGNAGFANGNIALRNNGLNNFFSTTGDGFQGTGGNELAWKTVNVAYTFTNDGTNITGYTADFTTAGGFFTPSFSVTKTGMSVASIDNIRFQFRGAAGDVYFDNVSITAIPEPSASALAGLAVLGLAGYRRRRA